MSNHPDDFDLNDLRAAMDTATPTPNADARAENLALARKNFETLQGSLKAQRHTSERPETGIFGGLRTMLNALTSKAGLTMTTAIVACGVLFVTLQGRDLLDATRGLTTPDTIVLAPEPEPDLAVRAEGSEVIAGLLDSDNEDGLDLRIIAEEAATEGFGSDMIAVPAPAAPAVTGEGRMIQIEVAPGIVAPADEDLRADLPNTETFANEAPNPLKITADEPVSTFSIDVDTASYSLLRSSITRGQLPPAEAIRIEEMINYFPYDYAAPEADGAPFAATTSVFQTPWNPDTLLLHVGLQGALPQIEDRPPLNLVFLIDTSGSMNDVRKLPLLRQSFRLMLAELNPEDQISIVTYAGTAGQVLEPTSAADTGTIIAALNNLSAGGSTAGQAGLQQAYSVAESMAEEGEITRVILATDGDFNVGISDPEALETYIAEKRDSGTYLSVLGFGRGNLDDATMQALAQNGNGTAAYIDTLAEAQKVLVDNLTGALFPIADDVKIQVEFNPSQIAEYRLIGYETRALNREDFNNDAVDAGEIGAGHSVTAIYEITPVGSPAQLSDPLRYGTEVEPNTSDELAFLRLRYKAPGEDESQLIETPITGTSEPNQEAQFAASIAGFGQLLTEPKYLNDWGWEEAIALANSNRGEDAFGYRTEAVQLMRLAQSLARR